METNTVVPTDYESFLTALHEGAWTQEQITGDEEQPPELVELLITEGFLSYTDITFLEPSQMAEMATSTSPSLPSGMVPSMQ